MKQLAHKCKPISKWLLGYLRITNPEKWAPLTFDSTLGVLLSSWQYLVSKGVHPVQTLLTNWCYSFGGVFSKHLLGPVEEALVPPRAVDKNDQNLGKIVRWPSKVICAKRFKISGGCSNNEHLNCPVNRLGILTINLHSKTRITWKLLGSMVSREGGWSSRLCETAH